MTTAFMTELLTHLAGRGLTLRVETDGAITIRDDKAARRKALKSARDRRHYQKRKGVSKSGGNVRNRVGIASNTVVHRGITWRDMFGHDEAAKKMNFSLFKRGMLEGLDSCHGLEGDALRAEFARINAGQKAKSHKAAAKRTEEAEKRRASEPAT